MNTIKLAGASLGLALAVAVGAPAAHATAIGGADFRFDDSGRMLVAMNGPASTAYTTGAGTNQVIDGTVRLDLSDLTYWADGFYNTQTLAPVGTGERGRSSRAEMTESINSWTLSLSHGGVTEEFSPVATGNELFGTNSLSFASDAFDGVVAGGEWILSAESDYWRTDKRKLQFDLAASFGTSTVDSCATNPNGAGCGGGSSSSSSSGGSSSSGAGSVPGPASPFLLFAGLLGMVALRRRSRAAA